MSASDIFTMDSINVTVPLKHLKKNPFRNLEVNPYDPAKVAGFWISFRETGYWHNTIGRPANNTIPGIEGPLTAEKVIAYLKERNFVVDFDMELAYGNTRTYALNTFNADPENADNKIEEVRIELKFYSDEQMIQIMGQENLKTWEHGIGTQIESVAQAYDMIQSWLKDFALDEHSEFVKEHPGYFVKSKSFIDVKNGKEIGPTYIRKFLGDGWTDKAIGGPLLAIKASRKGYFDLRDCYGIQSTSSLTSTVKLVNEIWESTNLMPKYFKKMWTDDILALVTPLSDETPIPVSRIEEAKKYFLQKYDPREKLRDSVLKSFDTVTLLESEFRLKEVQTYEDFEEKFDVEQFLGFDEAIDKALNNIAGAGKDNAGQSTDDSSSTNDSSSSSNTSNLDGAPNPTPTPARLEPPPAPPINYTTVSDNFIVRGDAFMEEARKLRNNMAQIPKDKAMFFARLEETIVTLVGLYREVFGSDKLHSLPNLKPSPKVDIEIVPEPKNLTPEDAEKIAKEVIEESKKADSATKKTEDKKVTDIKKAKAAKKTKDAKAVIKKKAEAKKKAVKKAKKKA